MDDFSGLLIHKAAGLSRQQPRPRFRLQKLDSRKKKLKKKPKTRNQRCNWDKLIEEQRICACVCTGIEVVGRLERPAGKMGLAGEKFEGLLWTGAILVSFPPGFHHHKNVIITKLLSCTRRPFAGRAAPTTRSQA